MKFISGIRIGNDSKKSLGLFYKKIKVRDRFTEYIELFLGKISPNRLIELSRQNDLFQQNKRFCESFFFIGHYFLLKNDYKNARKYFKKCVNTNVKSYIEYYSAKSELNQLSTKK